MRRLAYSSTRAVMPGGTTVVQSSCVTTAGPAKVWPGLRSARRNTAMLAVRAIDPDVGVPERHGRRR